MVHFAKQLYKQAYQNGSYHVIAQIKQRESVLIRVLVFYDSVLNTPKPDNVSQLQSVSLSCG